MVVGEGAAVVAGGLGDDVAGGVVAWRGEVVAWGGEAAVVTGAVVGVGVVGATSESPPHAATTVTRAAAAAMVSRVPAIRQG